MKNFKYCILIITSFSIWITSTSFFAEISRTCLNYISEGVLTDSEYKRKANAAEQNRQKERTTAMQGNRTKQMKKE